MKMLDSDRPIAPANAQNRSCVIGVLKRCRPNDKIMTNASGANMTTHINGVPKINCIAAGELDTANATTPVSARPSIM